MPPLRVIFSGGGTGGHLFPAIAIADEVRKVEPDADILFVGTQDKIEARVVPTKGFSFATIWISGFRRSIRLSNILFPLKLIVAMIQARSIIKHFRPDVVVGTGGYVSGPVLRAAVQARVPTLIQEQNSYPGVTTRLLAKKVNEVHVTFEASKKFLSGARQLFVSGNPTRGDLQGAARDEAMRYFKFDERSTDKTLLIFGGSLGAHTINEAVVEHLDEFMNRKIRLIWQTGKEDFALVRQRADNYRGSSCWIGAFIDRMDLAYAASDLVVCRAGATTIAEITRLGKPAILVPYPFAAANHQVENARAIAAQGAAVIIDDQRAKSDLLAKVETLLQSSNLQEMSHRSKALGMPDAARNIAQRVVALGRMKDRAAA